jgi:penicillin-insensitive murein DD-endopeptidase
VRIAAVLILAGCAELGVVGDGTSVSIGVPWRGHLVDGARIPSSGVGFTSRPVWVLRGARYGTDELVELITGVARRMSEKVPDVRLVVADLATRGGAGGDAFHRSHQTGRDADLVFYMRKDGQPFEPDAMHVFNDHLVAEDGSGITLDLARQWLLVRELLTAPEAKVQYLFIYQPFADKLIQHAKDIGEPDELIERAKKALHQPGHSALHNDHMHVRIYCSDADRAYGCEDVGPLELRDAPVPLELPRELAVMGTHRPLD